MAFWKRNTAKDEEIERLQNQISDLQRRVWAIENPPEYSAFDKVRVYIESRGGGTREFIGTVVGRELSRGLSYGWTYKVLHEGQENPEGIHENFIDGKVEE